MGSSMFVNPPLKVCQSLTKYYVIDELIDELIDEPTMH